MASSETWSYVMGWLGSLGPLGLIVIVGGVAMAFSLSRMGGSNDDADDDLTNRID